MAQSILAKFDGGVIVPDEPLALQPGQRLRVEIEPIEANEARFAELLELGAEFPTLRPILPVSMIIISTERRSDERPSWQCLCRYGLLA